jgi:hypothetical protein
MNTQQQLNVPDSDDLTASVFDPGFKAAVDAAAEDIAAKVGAFRKALVDLDAAGDDVAQQTMKIVSGLQLVADVVNAAIPILTQLAAAKLLQTTTATTTTTPAATTTTDTTATTTGGTSNA